MRDVIGVLFLIMGGAAITKHFALGIPFFIGDVQICISETSAT